MGGTLLEGRPKDFFEKLGQQRNYNNQQRDSKQYGIAGGGSTGRAFRKALSREKYRFCGESERFRDTLRASITTSSSCPTRLDFGRPYTITYNDTRSAMLAWRSEVTTGQTIGTTNSLLADCQLVSRFKLYSLLTDRRPWDKYLTERGLDWKDFYPLHIVYHYMSVLETTFPSTCTVSVIGRTAEGRDIRMLKISNSSAENTGVWIDGATHAREWISTSVVTYMADHIARHFANMSANFTNKDWYFVPVVNPDGYNYTHMVDRLWRKNRARLGNNIVGVDINRNFGYYWGRGGHDHASADPNHSNYRGAEPFSEPETTAIKDIILYSGTPFKIFLTYHAYSEAIAFPWCHTAEPCPDYVNLLEGGTAMAKAIFQTSGRMYKVGNFKDIMYYAAGTSIDWSYGTARIPYSYLVELRSKQDKFLLNRDEILICCKEALSGVKALVEFAAKTHCMNCAVYTKKLRQ